MPEEDAQPIGPVRPEEIGALKQARIPGWVFEAINNLLVHRRKFTLTEAVAAVMLYAPDDFKREQLFKLNYMDFEPAYRTAGWSVVFDKSAWNETGPDVYIFSAGKAGAG